MKRLLLLTGLILSFSMLASAAWTWEDSSNVENSGLFDQIKNANSASDYCPEASNDNKEKYCVQVEGWDAASLQGNDGLDNILSIYTELSDNGDLENSEIDALLTIYTCYNEETADTVGDCVDQDFDFSVFSSVNPSELRLTSSDNGGNDESNYDGGDSENNEDESGDDQDNEHTHEFGDIYFYDTEGEVDQMNTEAENNYDGQTVEYDMYDNSIEGYFGWSNLDEVEHTLWVRNEETGESRSTTSSSDEITVPPSTAGETFSTTEGEFYELSSDECTSFNIGVLPPEWDGSDSDVSGDAEQFNQFTLCPDSAQDDSNEEGSVTKSSGGYTFEVTPPPNDIATDDDVTLTVTESGEDVDLSNKRIRFALNDIAGVLPNDPYTTVECSDAECSATITSDRIEGEPGTVDARVDERRRTQTGYNWRPSESVSWNVD